MDACDPVSASNVVHLDVGPMFPISKVKAYCFSRHASSGPGPDSGMQRRQLLQFCRLHMRCRVKALH